MGPSRFRASPQRPIEIRHFMPRAQRVFCPSAAHRTCQHSISDSACSLSVFSLNVHSTVAISNFTGAAASGFIGNAYLPSGFVDVTHSGQRSVIVFGGMAAQNIAQEFAPELGRFLEKIHLIHIPLPPFGGQETSSKTSAEDETGLGCRYSGTCHPPVERTAITTATIRSRQSIYVRSCCGLNPSGRFVSC